MKNYSKKSTLVLALLCTTFIASSCQNETKYYQNGGELVSDSTTYTVTCEGLEDSSLDRDAWLSIPDSILVINPFDFENHMTTDERQSEFFNRENLSVDIGILDPMTSPKRMTNIFGTAAVNSYGGYLYANDDTMYATRPDRMVNRAKYDNGCQLTTTDYFYNENTVVRITEGNENQYAYWGAYGAGNIKNIVVSETSFAYRTMDGVVVSVAFSCSGEWKFYDTMDSFSLDREAAENPQQSGVWCYVPDYSDRTALSITIGDRGENSNSVTQKASMPFTQNNYLTKLSEREKSWNVLLNKAPRPDNFDLVDLADKGVTAKQIESYYYRSWVTVIAGTLPAHDSFKYRSICCGKASMWAGGSPQNKYSCIWESLFGTQMYAFIDPEIAWELCLGSILSIPEDGNILGESLPSNKAETVWVCYQALQDKEKLASCVEPLARYFEWRYDNPRWILGGHNYTDEKDADFVSSYLVDLKFMRKICAELGKTADVEYWRVKGESLYTQSLDWFLRDDGIVQCYFTETGNTTVGTPLWIDKYLWTEELNGEAQEILLDYAISQYDRNATFAGFGGVKYDSFAYTTYGLLKYGQTEIAGALIQSSMRDIVRSGFIGELYNANKRGTVCEGVRPSLFGAVIMIDSVWLRNGFMFHEGGITAINLYDGGVSNIVLNGKTYNLSVKDGIAELSGSKTSSVAMGETIINSLEI